VHHNVGTYTRTHINTFKVTAGLSMHRTPIIPVWYYINIRTAVYFL